MESVLSAWSDTKAPHPLGRDSGQNSSTQAQETQPARMETSPDHKPHRKQVSRACDWCRAKRIKCDDQIPCRACVHRGAECTVRGSQQARTLPQASKEIIKLKDRVAFLEAEVEKYRLAAQQCHLLPSPSATPPDSIGSIAQETSELAIHDSENLPHWEGIYTISARTDQVSYYGPSSLLYFISRIGTFLSKPLQQPFAARNMQNMQPRGVSKTLESPSGANVDMIASTSPAAAIVNPSMSRQQEEYFLNIFWEGYNALLPIVDEAELRKHYDSLWEEGKPQRKNSALIDIIIALCMQHAYTWLFGNTSNSPSQKATTDDATIAGRWYFRRCQALLSADMESPNITTIQCLIFSIVYLCCASFQNMAHIMMAQAVRAAQVIGLHLEPPRDMPSEQRQLRKRVWWVLLTTETKTCMKLGRPFSTSRWETRTSQPSDDENLESVRESSLGSYAGVSYLSYARQAQGLVTVVAEVYQLLYKKLGQIEANKGQGSIYTDLKALESCGEFLTYRASAINEWVQNLPLGLKAAHRSGAEPFSFDRSPIDIDTRAPRWLLTQRVCIELTYHAISLSLYRPFILFSKPSTPTPISDRHATTCVNHAIAHTLIMHQVVTETEILSGWTEYFIWQWNACITIVGFVLANPVHPTTPHAKQALDKSIEIFDVFGVNFAVAASAAAIARDFKGKIAMLFDRLRMGIVGGSGGTTPGTMGGTTVSGESVEGGKDAMMTAAAVTPGLGNDATGAADDMSWLDAGVNDSEFSNLMDWALSIDSFGSLEKLQDGSSQDFWKLA